jgi:mevalonate pyrophosphate decarboxylase
MYRNKRFLEKMRELPCAVCGADDGTVIAAHRNQGKGMGLKVSDALVAPLCFTCHQTLDQGKDLSRDDRRDMWDQAYIRNIQNLIETGQLKIG